MTAPPTPTASVSVSGPAPAEATASVSPNDLPVAALIRAAYQRMWVDSEAAGRQQNPAILHDHASGIALANLMTTYNALHTHQDYESGPVSTNPVVTALSPASVPTSAEITDCYSEKHVKYLRQGTNAVIGVGADGGSIGKARAALQPDGVWRITYYSTTADHLGTCTPGD